MVNIESYIKNFASVLPLFTYFKPWELTEKIVEILYEIQNSLENSFEIKKGIAIHHTATIETNVIMKAPIIIGANCFVGANGYLRNGVFLVGSCRIGPACEIKSSFIFNESSIAHFNFIGDSIIGNNVNFEAGSLTANHYNERENKDISVLFDSGIINTKTQKFGSLIGDNSRIGANAVLSPGTLLKPESIVKRLELVDQVGENRRK